MAEQITPKAIDVLRQLARVGPGGTPPPVDFTIAAELASRGLAGEAWHGGMVITEAGRQYLRDYG